MLNLILNHLPMLIGILVGLFVLYNSITVAGGRSIILLERRWFGKEMADGRTVALSGEVGIQARILGPGFHFLIPFIYKTQRAEFVTISQGQVGVVTARTGKNTCRSLMASHVECSDFQDGEAFLKNGGEKGPQLKVLPPGEYQINPRLFNVQLAAMVTINEDQVGTVEARDGAVISRPGGNFGKPVACSNYEDARAFLDNGGEKGPQVAILPPGSYRINLHLFKVTVDHIVEIPGGKIGLVEATDGLRIPEGRLLGKKIEGHRGFCDGDAFLSNGGERGRQMEVLMPGRYRINPLLFPVVETVPWVNITAEEVGIVTVREGAALPDGNAIAATELPLSIHDNYQNPSAFLAAKGQKGLQIPVLRAGNYAINPWFAQVDKNPMTKVDIGFCGVVTSFVGEEGEDTSGENVNAKIVANGQKGIWSEPLQPGLHPLNTRICKVDIVPTTQILLNWADNESSAHDLDSNLSTITLRTADAFDVKMDVSVIIHIPMGNAPKVIANLGSVKSMISQVLEPAISSHFRNAAQYIKALDIYTERKELQERAKEHISRVLLEHHIDSKDTLIADVVLTKELIKTVTDRQIAEQEKKTFATQKEAAEEQRALANAQAQAAMQPRVVESERMVEIEKNQADANVQKAEGERQAAIAKATGEAEATKLHANAEAEATKLTGAAKAEAASAVGLAEASVIEAKGQANAKSYKLEVDAMGREIFGQIRVINEIANNKMKLIPDNLIMGGGGATGNGGALESFMGISLLEKLTGKSFNSVVPETK
jgi:uncharacterized membrane protein YqiK